LHIDKIFYHFWIETKIGDCGDHVNVVRYLNCFQFILIRKFGNGQEPEFAEHFLLEYRRKSLAKWVRYKDIKSEEVCDMCVLRSPFSITLQPFLYYIFLIANQFP
jgi:hypothetical protein